MFFRQQVAYSNPYVSPYFNRQNSAPEVVAQAFLLQGGSDAERQEKFLALAKQYSNLVPRNIETNNELIALFAKKGSTLDKLTQDQARFLASKVIITLNPIRAKL